MWEAKRPTVRGDVCMTPSTRWTIGYFAILGGVTLAMIVVIFHLNPRSGVY